MPDSHYDSPTMIRQRPEARGFRVEDLLTMARVGKLRVPSFQRPLRWRSKQVIDLFDSIGRGFPVGELLLARRHAAPGTVSFGPVSFEVPEQPAAYWVVDGQQRITALVATLLRMEVAPKRDIWAIWYDVLNERFEWLRNHGDTAAWIPVNAFSDSKKQLKWLNNWPYGEGNEELADRIYEIGRSIREYEIPSYIVEGVDEPTLRLIFTRVNTGGVEMKESEIFNALYEHEGEKPLTAAVARLADTGFGLLGEDLFLRCVRTMVGVKPKTLNPNELPADSIRRTEMALRRAIGIIMSEANIPLFKLMPYRLPLYVLTAFFDRYAEYNSRVDRQLGHWIWRGALSGNHEDSTDPRVAELVGLIELAESADMAVQSLIEPFASITAESGLSKYPEGPDQRVSLKSANSKMFILALWDANPTLGKDFTSNLLIADEESADSSDQNLDAKKLVLSLFGNEKLGTDVVIRLPEMKKSDLLSVSETSLESFLLNTELVQLWQQNDREKFRESRRCLLEKHIEKFVHNRLGDHVDMRPSIRSITTTSPTTAVLPESVSDHGRKL